MKILITGKNGYIANNLRNKIGGELTDTRNSVKNDSCDILIHCSGIVHRNDAKAEEYRKVNVELTKEIAQKISARHFIFLSTMSVYGKNSGYIDKTTLENPKSFYGETKLIAENYLRENIENLTILRPPMVYGKGCSGNYARLSSFAQSCPFFPLSDNKRSMIYIENLCEFVSLVIKNKAYGTLFPQNKEYVNTSEMFYEIRKNKGQKTFLLPFPVPKYGIFEKIFGNLCYDLSLSDTFDFSENKIDFKQSIRLCEMP